ncbi:ABC transporter permease [Gulosibacter sp. ACHW.36C]|uniref:ABC transporter permease n=1 Tax=Gulosibacter sediminis TaxID=1729695 RepID=A0ABY4MWP1_9MICO|nr:ABC transporter permease [Gulosibacter sediminis]UQN14835.1 ABC transporter permease [Gulosibacter sediminis]
MARWALRRVLTGLVTLLGIAVVVFLSVRLVPGQAERVLLGPLASAEDRAALVSSLGLDRDLFTQFGLWISNVLTGDLGTSIISRQPVTDELALRLPVTATLAVLALIIALIVGIPLGIWQGVRAHRKGGAMVSRVVSGLAISVPEFVLGALVVLVFSIFPLGITIDAVTPVTENFFAGVASLLLPALVLSVFYAAATARTARDATLGVLVEPYIQAAKARGDRPGTIIRRHVLRNASIPILTLAATLLAYLLGGAVIVEGLFNVPGVGSYMLLAMDRRDFAVVQAVVMFAAIVFVVASMVVELASSLIDPRVSSVEAKS